MCRYHTTFFCRDYFILFSKNLLKIYAYHFYFILKKLFRRRQWQPTPVLLPGKSHGWTSLVGCSPWGRYESDMTERLHFHFSLSCIGEGNGNPLQCSCLENPRDGGAWWAAVYGVMQSRTRLKRLSSLAVAAAILHPHMCVPNLSWSAQDHLSTKPSPQHSPISAPAR